MWQKESKDPLKVRELNDRLMMAERAFADRDGLFERPWYKHLVSLFMCAFGMMKCCTSLGQAKLLHPYGWPENPSMVSSSYAQCYSCEALLKYSTLDRGRDSTLVAILSRVKFLFIYIY